MAEHNQVRRTGASKSATINPKSAGVAVPAGVYEATVQGFAPNNPGQLFVTILGWSAIVNDPNAGSQSDQIPVTYCNPFFGTTYGTNTGGNPDTPQTAGQSYGMWMVPPDIGNNVLVMFTNAGKGFWIGCVVDTPSHHMVPGIGRNVGTNTLAPPTADGISQYFNSSSNVPVVEGSLADAKTFTTDGTDSTSRYPAEFQAMHYVRQGLDQDKIRGAISSSSLRESPSNVYGISTPGRSSTGTNPQYSGNNQAVSLRQGGHTFVMDDGAAGTGSDPAGTDQLIRLRTSGGHQILMNDTENILYVASASGSQWLEFSADGSINIFAAAGINMRTSGAMNFHSDAGISMCSPHISLSALPPTTLPTSAGSALGAIPSISINSSGTLGLSSLLATSVKADGAVSVSALGAVNVSAGAALKMSAIGAGSLSALGVLNIGAKGLINIAGSGIGLNCTPPISSLPIIVPVVPPIPNVLPDTLWTGSGWTAGGSKVLSTCSTVPAHEPWVRASAGTNYLAMGTSVASLGTGFAGVSTGGADAVSGAL